MTAGKILVIDDDPDFVQALTIALELEGYAVDVAASGKDGIAVAQSALNEGAIYDAVLIDIGLPGLNGVETLRRIRQVSPASRCFLLTGHSADDLMRQGIDAGAVEILTKPVDVAALLLHLAGSGDSRTP